MGKLVEVLRRGFSDGFDVAAVIRSIGVCLLCDPVGWEHFVVHGIFS
jgi:hypothetical protein